ncbi:MAG: hydroxymethylglutaryl-CoA reductase [Betaproteobacteria bacterium]|nr:hydroxymethylglutaryl-CoA reductase [Betaproteobacteria bacterium]
MPINKEKLHSLIARLSGPLTLEKFGEELSSRAGPAAPGLRHASPLTGELLARNWDILRQHSALGQAEQNQLADTGTLEQLAAYSKNIENCVGTIKLPVGVAGPLRVNGFFAKGDFYVPLATTEAALVASYHRGARLITAAGGCTALLHDDAISRSPGFIFRTLTEAGQFVLWAMENFEKFCEVTTTSTRYGKLMDMRFALEGNHVYMNLDFYTGEAAGQNMVTLATAAIVNWIREHTPVTPQNAFVEANFSGDKKASSLSFTTVRGKKVTAEVFLPKTLVGKYLHTSPEMMRRYWQMAAIGGVMSGTMGVQGHFANGLAALYLAVGQDAACISESSVGITRLEVTDEGGLYATVTLPNIIVGTVGGGTKLPSQSACMKMLNLSGEGQAHSLAEICASVCLAGELSIMGAIAADQFAAAHERLARHKGKS